MGEIIIKVPGKIKETIEISDLSLIQKILDLKKENPRENWEDLLKTGNKDNLLIEDTFEDEDFEWWEW